MKIKASKNGKTRPIAISRQHRDYLKKQGITTPEQIAAHQAANGREVVSDVVVKGKLGVQRLRKATADAENAEIDVSEKKGLLVESARAVAAQTKNNARVRAMLDAAFRSELPARQGGLPSDKIAAMNCERLDEIYAELSKPITQ